MKAGRFNPARTEVKPDNSVILFWVGPYRMGIAAAALREIRSFRRLVSNESVGHQEESFGCVAILAAGTFFGVRTGAGGRLLLLRSQNVGVRVDKVERMVEIGKVLPLPKAFQGEERSWYGGIALVGEEIVLLLNPETLAHEALSQVEQSGCDEEANRTCGVEVRT